MEAGVFEGNPMANSLAIFEGYQIRRHYDEKAETWYFSVVDTVAALTDSVNARDYWFKMKIRVKSEDGIELSIVELENNMNKQRGLIILAETNGVCHFIQYAMGI